MENENQASPNDSDGSEGFGERGYRNYPLRGDYENLNVHGRRPLFILKENWDDGPCSKQRSQSYRRIMDDRTAILLKIYSHKIMNKLPSALVEWRVRTGPNKGKSKQTGCQCDPNKAGTSCESSYMHELAMLNAEVAGAQPEASEEDEVLSVVSSDDEVESDPNNAGADDDEWTTIYYPLVPQPTRVSHSVTRKKLLREILSNKNCASMHGTAREMVDEIDRLRGFPTITGSTY
ncbi:hypothetical protein CTheo_7522 [Ceratobasidium theobromae]|uniref:Uncharacterized protein n=1 Tax=Ceratobasidium theobromae TaxID=1582974 RepID=A0A5N5QBJ8_9AGAM|nr:hypothetical protein CTheo_7522 [Ceratobasidium theobromae]